MPIIQDFPDELNYANAKLHPLSPKCGSFLECFLHAALRADHENYPLMRFMMHAFMVKYPADPERLEQEIRESYLHSHPEPR